MSESFPVLGVKIKITTMKSAVAEICEHVELNKQMMIVTANPEIVMMCKNDDYYKKIVNSADAVFADGVGIVWAGRHLGYNIPERIAGFDLTLELFQIANANKYKIFLFGAHDGIAEKAIEKIQQKHPDIEFVGCRHGFFKEGQVCEIIEEINAAKPDILLVALGAPKQEKFIFENKDKLDCKIFLGIGGAFDVLAGKSKRAPAVWQKCGLEWFYRLCMQPQRIGRMLSIPKFVFHVLLSKKN